MTEDLIHSYQDPFTDCLLGRREYADILTRIIKAENKGFVMGLNNPWGYGKTTFIKMWEKQLQYDGYKTVYFNAWENDFEKNPLIALLSELKPLVPQEEEDGAFREALKKASVMMKKVVPTLAKLAVKFSIGSADASELVEKISEGYVEILDEEIQDYASKKQGLREFRDALERAIQKITEDKPLIFFIDELDRCRPDYAVELIENVKHLFTVKNIIFVLSIDKEHLACSIKGYYGSENFNTDEYLRRFIDLEYSLPMAGPDNFIDFLFNAYGMIEAFNLKPDSPRKLLSRDLQSVKNLSKHVFSTHNITPRQQERILYIMALAMKSYDRKYLELGYLFFMLAYIKVIYYKSFEKICSAQISLTEIQGLVYEILQRMPEIQSTTRAIDIEAILIVTCYNDQINREDLNSNERRSITSEYENLESRYSNPETNSDLGKARYGVSLAVGLRHLRLSNLAKRIALVSPQAQ